MKAINHEINETKMITVTKLRATSVIMIIIMITREKIMINSTKMT